MKLIAVISHKGGAGKTTSSVQIAEELARRGHRTLLVDADRQQGAGLLLGIDAPAGCVQRTMVPNLDYLGSARLTDLEIADCYASIADRFDVGVVDTPSLDDALARAWLREATAILMVLQVDPLTVKTLPNALNTLEMVRAFQPTIQILGLLPTMFDPAEEAHGRLLAELLARRPEAVFTPVVPADSGLMHRANSEDCPPVGEAARQAFQCAVDRILRALESAAPSVSLPRAGVLPAAIASTRPSPPAAALAAETGAPAVPAGPEPRRWQEAPVEAPPSRGAAIPEIETREMGEAASPAPAAAPGGYPAPPVDDCDRALEELAHSEDTRTPQKEGDAAKPGRKQSGEESVPDWWPRQEGRVDSTGVARRPESWLMRSRFAIACTVACLALLAAVVMGTIRRVPAVAVDHQAGALWERHVAAALAATHEDGHPTRRGGSQAGAAHSGESHKKLTTGKHAHHTGQAPPADEEQGSK